MGIYETFSKRQKKLLQAGEPDPYQYDDLPHQFRVQVVHIWNGVIGSWKRHGYSAYEREATSNVLWTIIENQLAREIGVLHLGDSEVDMALNCKQHVLNADVSHALDIIEYSFRLIYKAEPMLTDSKKKESGITQTPDDAIEELNHRFMEHSIGYQFAQQFLTQEIANIT